MDTSEEEKVMYAKCFASVVYKMEDEERGMLKCVLSFKGKNFKKEAGDIVGSSERLKEFGKDVTGDWVAERLGEIFTEGTGFVDTVTSTQYNYGKQLDIVINKILVKSLKVSKPFFSKAADTYEGAVQREKWIVQKLMDSIIDNMDENEKKEFVKQVEEMIKEKGLDAVKATQASAALLTGGLTAAKTVMKFGFHKMVAITANLIVRVLTGKGLSFAANAALQRMCGVLFGPIGWAISVATILPSIPSLVNPRDYGRYIPAIFIIGAARLSQNDDKKITDEDDGFEVVN